MEIVGWISTICFTVAGLPQVIKASREGHASGVSLGFLSFWYLGNVFGASYSIVGGSVPLSIGFLTSVFFGSILFYFKLFKQKKKVKNEIT